MDILLTESQYIKLILEKKNDEYEKMIIDYASQPLKLKEISEKININKNKLFCKPYLPNSVEGKNKLAINTSIFETKN